MGRMKKFASLQRIEGSREITRERDGTFWYGLQDALLLALLEQGRIGPMEHRQAREKLNRQRRAHAKESPAEP